MTDIINLKQFKKRKARAEKQQQSSENRILFGRTKAEKAFDNNKAKHSAAFLDQHRLTNADKTAEQSDKQSITNNLVMPDD